MNRRNIRILSGVMALAIFASATNVFATTTAEYDEQISEIKAQQEANEAEAAELNATLGALRAKTADAEEYQATLERKIENYQQSIDLTREHIDELNGSIKELEGEIKKADAEYASTLEKLKKRLKALYTSGGELTTLEILLDSTSLYDFSMRSEAVKSFTRHDKLLMEEIKDYMLKTQEQRDALSAQKTELADQKKALESKQAELEALEAENQKLIEDLNIQSANAEALIAQNERESQDYLAQLDQLIADRAEQAAREEEERRKAEEEAQKNQGSSGGSEYVPSGGGSVDSGDLSFGWPLAGYGYGSITQYYGGMYSGTPHKGLDIGVPYGTPIYASESGQVLSAEYHWSWGNNVLIWHNGTYSTRYAHCSSLAVSAGQYVEKGQVIGYVGSTGQSSGPHLHFEVYQNGTRVDPLGFV
ncbi:murein hydrolase activator EnvC family protein [Anaeromassilibacillus senegalensis]|uniref:Peptidoglycan DD-metalloendopeptidase family protein n=1 Tax=Anaeromassilibacillus senegalensis TaxID=1673717 RepID=A0ABS9CML4_9FIRM|nr:M23 family metallopeptidase [Anaeromassilibacillus senegalensis]MCF2652385.1 peptidoglycan DD-metalloendopeptidase family protein [Anaeromassilibacillus senegalensis]